MPNYDPDQNYFRKMDQRTTGGTGRVVLTGSVPIWRCPKCSEVNAEKATRCANCGQPKEKSE